MNILSLTNTRNFSSNFVPVDVDKLWPWDSMRYLHHSCLYNACFLKWNQNNVMTPVCQKDFIEDFFPYGKKSWFPTNLIIRGHWYIHTVVIGSGFHWDLRFSKPCGLHQQETMTPTGNKRVLCNLKDVVFLGHKIYAYL